MQEVDSDVLPKVKGLIKMFLKLRYSGHSDGSAAVRESLLKSYSPSSQFAIIYTLLKYVLYDNHCTWYLVIDVKYKTFNVHVTLFSARLHTF